MKFKNEFDSPRRRKEHPHSSHSHTPYLGLDPRNGVPIQCQFCSGKAFRRSTLRSDDFTQIFLMRYPVRCLRCSQRQMVSFTVASLSLSSSVKPRRKHRPVDPSKRWVDFTKHPDAPNPLEPTPSEEESHSRSVPARKAIILTGAENPFIRFAVPVCSVFFSTPTPN